MSAKEPKLPNEEDVREFKEIFDSYYTPLVRFARLSVELEIAEEIVQDVFMALWLRRQEHEVKLGLAPYLFGAVKNRTASWIRHERVIRRGTQDHVALHPPGMGEAPEAPDWSIIEQEDQRAVKRAISELSELQREVITLRWEEKLSYEQIASILSISPAAAKQNGSRAQRAIRAALGEKTE